MPVIRIIYRALHDTVYHYLNVQANITVLAWAKGGLFIVLGEKVILFVLLVYLVAVAYVGWASVSGATCICGYSYV